MSDQEVGNLAVKISMDSSGFQNGVAGINTQLKVVQSEFKASSAELGGFGNSTDLLKLKTDSLSQQIELQKQKVTALEQAYQTSAENKGKDATATQNLEIKLNQARTALANMNNELGKTNVALEEGAAKQGLFATASEKLGLNLNGVKTAFGVVGVAAGAFLENAIGSAEKAQESTATLTNLLQNQGMTADKAKEDISSFTGAITKMSDFSAGEAKAAFQELTEKGVSAGNALANEGTLANVAAGMNISLADAADMLAAAYNGKGRALSALGILNKEEAKDLAAGKDSAVIMADVQQRLNDRFSGAAQDQLKTYNGQMKAMENEMTAAKTTIGTALLPVLAILAESLAKIITPITDFVQKNPQFTAALLAIVAVVGTLVGGLSLLATASSALSILGPMFGVIGGAAGAAALPIVGVVAAIALVGVAAYELITHWSQVEAFFVKLWDDIKNAFSDGIETTKAFFVKWGPDILAILTGPIGLIVLLIVENWTTIQAKTKEVWNAISQFLSDLWNTIKTNVSNAWNAIYTVLSGIWEKITGGFNDLVKDAENWGLNLIDNFIQGIKNKISALGDTLKDTASIIAGYLGFHSPTKLGPGAEADQWAPNFVNMFAEGIKSSLPNLQASLNTMALTLNPIATGASAGFSNNYSYGGININIAAGGTSQQAYDLLRELHSQGINLR
jgi:hypothetical protein